MKKILKSMLIMAIFACLIITFTGCGKKEDEKDIEDEVQNAIERTEEILQQENATSANFSMGEWENNVYTNDFLGLKFNLPEGWVYSSKEEIAEMMNMGTELLNDDQKAAAEIAKLNSAYYMVANNPNTGDNITIISEKPMMDVDTEYYINQLKTQLTTVQSISYKIGEVSKEKISNVETDTLTVTGTMYGVEVSQRYYIYKLDNYIVSIIATSTVGEDTINEIVKNFE